MAEVVWREFKEDDSKFCRSCHTLDAMDLEAQERRTARRHSQAADNGQTCIDCHYGIVHELPEGSEAILERLQEEFADD